MRVFLNLGMEMTRLRQMIEIELEYFLRIFKKRFPGMGCEAGSLFSESDESSIINKT
jgi:hypothetical protein